MQSFTTDDLPDRQKTFAWSDMVRPDVALGEIAYKNPDHFDGRLQRIELGPMVISDIRCSAVHIRYVPDVAETSHNSYLVFMPLDNSFELSLNGRSGSCVGSGEVCLVDLTQPHELVQHGCARSFFLRFPRRYLDMLVPRVAHLTGQVMTADRVASRLLHSLLRELFSEHGQSNYEALPHYFFQSILNLIAGLYAERLAETADPDTCARAQVFRHYIDTNLANPDLRQTDIARHFRVSDRYVRAVMHANGINFSNYVLEKRLDLSRRLLKDPQLRSISITEISFLAGFNSASHFGRAFKERFGISPGRFRRNH
jgi:AraC-like DNA-binding protein